MLSLDMQPLDILKWVGIVLAAGFIGYFGRYLAMLILERVHKKKEQTAAEKPTVEIASSEASQIEASRLKLEKKRAKQAAKKAKKEGKT